VTFSGSRWGHGRGSVRGACAGFTWAARRFSFSSPVPAVDERRGAGTHSAQRGSSMDLGAPGEEDRLMATFANLSADNPNLSTQYDERGAKRAQNGEGPTDY
jgi:hypothetical protein